MVTDNAKQTYNLKETIGSIKVFILIMVKEITNCEPCGSVLMVIEKSRRSRDGESFFLLWSNYHNLICCGVFIAVELG